MRNTWLLILIFVGIPALGQNAFDGTWRLNMKDAQFKGTQKYLLKDGLYNCDTCDPKIQGLKADGQPHATSGSPYYDSVTVRELDDHTVEFVSTKNGKPAGRAKVTVSGDGNTTTMEQTFLSENGQQNTEKDVYRRVGEVPAGANKISGTWQQEKIEDASQSETTLTYKATADGLSMSDGMGDSYTAKFDGKDYPYKGDPGTTSVSLKRVDANTVEETDKRNGKVISVAHMIVQPDKKTMKIVIEDKVHNSVESLTANKE